MTFSFLSHDAAALARNPVAQEQFDEHARRVSGRSGIISLYAFDYEDHRPRMLGRGRPLQLENVLRSIRIRDWDGRPTGFFLVPFQPLPPAAQEIARDAVGFGLDRLARMSRGPDGAPALITRSSGLDPAMADHPIIDPEALAFSPEGLRHEEAGFSYLNWADVCDLHQERDMLILFLNGGGSISFLPAMIGARPAFDRMDQA